ncbi:hypothetical protein Mal4_18400 [Maioricimonas rarisocia]|uniref:Uncharacterized protein n=1 Tax=Maioricimonas rarisocia TaxID=2528026 RepID=A0A517Z4W5_9PLAN|nr:hypothetical protein [Maioricimonas rarisocia]QDU37526.1 hypothetical protein Mal4_18400 [Maioricimonas rarisocia]
MQRRRRTTRTSGHPRGGFLYIAVMGTATIVAVIALTGLHVARLYLKAATAENERLQAQALASSAIEHALAEFNTNPTWETDYGFNIEYPSPAVAVGGGTFSWKLIDAGNGSKTVQGIGRVGDAVCTYAVDLGSSSGPNYLSYGLLSGGDLWVGNFTTTESLAVNGADICSNATVENWGSITGNVEAQVIDNNGGTGTISGTQTAPASVQPLPDPTTVFDWYVSNGTTISNGPLDDGLGGLSLSNCLLSPFNNPFGTANSDGIYVINAAGKPLSIRRCRIVGTLVVLNATWGVAIREDINWEPAYPNYPAILVEGDLEIRIHDQNLTEASAGTNFNPLLTPYQGSTDLLQNDSYPSRLAGVIYCSGDMLVDGKNASYSPKIQGAVIVGGWCLIDKTAQISIDYDDTAAITPPPGFGSGDPASIVPGSWRQIPSS